MEFGINRAHILNISSVINQPAAANKPKRMTMFHISNFEKFESTKRIYRKGNLILLDKNIETSKNQLDIAQPEPSHTNTPFDSVINEVSIIERNINIVMTEASVTKEVAFEAIRKNNWSVQSAISELCKISVDYGISLDMSEEMEENSYLMPLLTISKIQNDLFEEEMEEMPLCTESESSRCGILDEEDVFTIDL